MCLLCETLENTRKAVLIVVSILICSSLDHDHVELQLPIDRSRIDKSEHTLCYPQRLHVSESGRLLTSYRVPGVGEIYKTKFPTDDQRSA